MSKSADSAKQTSGLLQDLKPGQPGVEKLIVNVYKDNFKAEMERIMDIVDKFPYVAMDTEFPGVVIRPIGNFTKNDYHYQTLKSNVDILKIIQLGLTFSDANGIGPPGPCTWQFNFKFNLQDDIFSQDSIDMLQTSGLNFQSHSDNGIDVRTFAEVIMTSGIVLNDEIKWITFHSGYDFAYLIRLLSCMPLPKEENEFFELLQLYFPCIYDIKYLMRSCEPLQGGLQRVAEYFQLSRIGTQHQAGSDSLLTSSTFFKIRREFFENAIDDDKFMGYIYGLGGAYKKKVPVRLD